MVLIMKKKILICVIFIIFSVVLIKHTINEKQEIVKQYTTGVNYYKNEQYDEAINTLESLGDYRDCYDIIEDSNEKREIQKQTEEKQRKYDLAITYLMNKDYEKALELFEELGDFSDSFQKVVQIEETMLQIEVDENIYMEGKQLFSEKKYKLALEKFMDIKNYKDSGEYIILCTDNQNRINHAHPISAGIRFSAAVTMDGDVLITGKDINKEIKSELERWKDMVSVSAYGEFIVGLAEDGTAESISLTSDYKIDTKEWNDVIGISTGDLFVVALKSDGTVIAQGHNGDGQLNVENWKDIIDIDCGWRHTVGLTRNGEVIIVGRGSDSQLQQIEKEKDKWIDIVSVSAGGGNNGNEGHTVALKKDGTVVAVGKNSYGQCNVDSWSGIIAISAGDFYTVGLKEDGTVVSTLSEGDSYAQMSEWNDIVAISAGYGITLGLKSDGSVVAAGYTTQGQGDVMDWTNVMVYD